MASIFVETPSGPYLVECERGVLRRAGELIRALGPSTGVSILTSPRVWMRWGGPLRKRIAATHGNPAASVFLFPDGETAKTLATLEKVCRGLAASRLDRRGIVVAVGGGVVGDVAGFAAASYLRGVRLVHIPTTLVAQVDSAIGGKTGVNLPEGKNLVGAFFQPALVLVDPEVLCTLPARQYRSGIYEVIKYAVLGDRHLFEFLENRMEPVLRQDRAALDWVLPRCIGAKAQIVSRDERESGPREALNLGHTFGHGLESLTRYRRFLHGEAVGWGLIAAARLAVAIDWLPREEADRVEALVRQVGPLPALPRIPPARWIAAMRADKKARGGRLRFILPHQIGEVRAAENVPERSLTRVLAGLAAREGHGLSLGGKRRG
ncbi:MAG TPA: 3-dehydroquinate synthase [Candidatus Acidoferrales bacterium]|nr:3-dehydroquinate synthase [Candidatus Acidoferrales bacterium]